MCMSRACALNTVHTEQPVKKYTSEHLPIAIFCLKSLRAASTSGRTALSIGLNKSASFSILFCAIAVSTAAISSLLTDTFRGYNIKHPCRSARPPTAPRAECVHLKDDTFPPTHRLYFSTAFAPKRVIMSNFFIFKRHASRFYPPVGFAQGLIMPRDAVDCHIECIHCHDSHNTQVCSPTLTFVVYSEPNPGKNSSESVRPHTAVKQFISTAQLHSIYTCRPHLSFMARTTINAESGTYQETGY